MVAGMTNEWHPVWFWLVQVRIYPVAAWILAWNNLLEQKLEILK